MSIAEYKMAFAELFNLMQAEHGPVCGVTIVSKTKTFYTVPLKKSETYVEITF